MGLSGVSMAGAKFAPSPAVRESPATTSPEQWAFGGSFSYSYSCSTTTCSGGNLTSNQTLSTSWSFSLTWAVIYTQTNVSGSQTEFGVQSALGVSLNGNFVACVTYGSVCDHESESFGLSGHESSTGTTNVTSGSTYLYGGTGSPATVAALAVNNASSQEAFNVSGNLAVTIPLTVSTSLSDHGTFDVGGSESSSIKFSSPLGIIPTTVAPGDLWSGSQTYTASGHYVSGLTASATENGTSYSYSTWQPGTVADSGVLVVNGNDTGTAKLSDTSHSPPRNITVQEILLQFSNGNFSASDGWLFASTGVLLSLANGLNSTSLATRAGPIAPAVRPALNITNETSNLSSTESAYYDGATHGFVGGNVLGNESNITSTLPGGGKVHLSAGPESVSAAQGQYNSILHPSSPSSFPLLLVLVVVVVVVVAAVAALMLLRRGKKPGPMAAPPPMAVAPSAGAPATPPTQP